MSTRIVRKCRAYPLNRMTGTQVVRMVLISFIWEKESRTSLNNCKSFSYRKLKHYPFFFLFIEMIINNYLIFPGTFSLCRLRTNLQCKVIITIQDILHKQSLLEKFSLQVPIILNLVRKRLRISVMNLRFLKVR